MVKQFKNYTILESLPHIFFYECYDNLLVNQEKLKNELE